MIDGDEYWHRGFRLISEQELKQEARIVALENLVMTLLALHYRAGEATMETVETTNAAILKALDHETFPGIDPATSDMLSGEIADATRVLLSGAAEKMRGQTYRCARGCRARGRSC